MRSLKWLTLFTQVGVGMGAELCVLWPEISFIGALSKCDKLSDTDKTLSKHSDQTRPDTDKLLARQELTHSSLAGVVANIMLAA